MNAAASSLVNKAILLVEDDYFLMSALKRSLEAQGAEIVGPAASVDCALALATTAPHLDAAVLDINLQDRMVFPVADVLRERDVPFLFTTGYDAASIPAQHGDIVRCEKPARPEEVIRSLNKLMELHVSGRAR